MNVKTSPLPSSSRVLLSYAVAVMCVAAATVLTIPLQTLAVHSLTLFFMAAVLVSAWHGGTWPGLLSVVLATASFEYFFSSHAGKVGIHLADVVRLAVFTGVALAISSLTSSRRAALVAEQHVTAELQRALDEIRVLRGIIPICSYCKQIRNDAGSWERLEKYIVEHSEAAFTHGICPECYKKHHPEIYKQQHGG